MPLIAMESTRLIEWYASISYSAQMCVYSWRRGDGDVPFPHWQPSVNASCLSSLQAAGFLVVITQGTYKHHFGQSYFLPCSSCYQQEAQRVRPNSSSSRVASKGLHDIHTWDITGWTELDVLLFWSSWFCGCICTPPMYFAKCYYVMFDYLEWIAKHLDFPWT